MPYLLIGALLSYVAMARIVASSRINLYAASVIATLAPFIIINLSDVTELLLKGESPLRLLALSTTIKLIVQFIVVTAVFYKLRESDDSITAWMGWTAIGVIAYFYAVPTLLSMTAHI